MKIKNKKFSKGQFGGTYGAELSQARETCGGSYVATFLYSDMDVTITHTLKCVLVQQIHMCFKFTNKIVLYTYIITY